MNQKVGLLCIQAPRAWRALYFDHRGVTLYYNEHTLLDRVLSSMVVTGQIDGAAVQDARDHAATTGGSVVDSLLASGHLGEDHLVDAFRAGMEEEIYDLFFWRDARFEFYEGASSFDGHDGVVNEQFFFSTDQLIMEAARRIDEWSYIRERVTGPLEVFDCIAVNSYEVEDDYAPVLDLCDGKRNVARLIEITGLPSFHVFKGLAMLLDGGYVQQVEPRQLLHNARECMEEGRLQDAINLYEKALSVGEGVPEAHTMVAKAYEAVQEFELAVYHLTCEAEFHAGNDNVKAAVPLLLHSTQLLPTDLSARERLVELVIGRNDVKLPDQDPVQAGKELVEIYLEIGETDRVRNILERLLRQCPDDLELKKALVHVHSKVGDTKRMIELYESIAADLVQAHNPIEAVKYLQKILMLDRSRKDVSERIKALYEMDERKRSRRRSLTAISVLFVVAAGLAGLWYLYEAHAREHYQRIDVNDQLTSSNFVAAASIYRTFIEAYPFTIVGREAEAELLRIQGLQTAHEAEMQAKQREREREFARRRASYKIEWGKYRSAFDGHDLVGALEILEKVRGMVSDVGEEEDRVWAEQMQLEKQYGELRTYMAEAIALQRSARQRLEAGKWQQARVDLLKLVREFGMAPAARSVRLPVMIASRPVGARILRRGEPVTIERDGAQVAVTTPAVVGCLHSLPEEFELELDGFEPQRVRVVSSETEQVQVVFTAVPDRRYRFSSPAQSTVGAGATAPVLAVGLRGGNVGLAFTAAEGRSQLVIKLPGLAELEGVPVILTDRVVFRTSDGRLVCHSQRDARQLWAAASDHRPQHDPLVSDGRVFFGDEYGRLVCLSLDSGRVLWTRTLDDVLSGTPAVQDRVLRVATRGGRLYRADAVDGRVEEIGRLKNQVTTPVLIAGSGVVLVGTSDGHIHAVQEGAATVWSTPIGQAVRGDQITLVPETDAVFVVGTDDSLVKLGLRDGGVLVRRLLGGAVHSGPVVANGHVFVVVSEKRERNEIGDVLRAYDLADVELQWEYRDPREFMGGIGSDGRGTVFVTSSEGEVVSFQ